MRSILLFIIIPICLTIRLSAQQLVLPGDYPDPSVVKIGDTYWASATTSNWFPAYPLLKSNDLVNWKTVGHVFDSIPEWADYYFWAPEITYDNGKVYIYYTAHKKNGNLCVAVASADRPEGPYKDHGPLICQEVGSIDGFPMRDENGKLYLIWKEDGNSVGRPTPIWAMEMNEERTELIGDTIELFRGDSNWESKLVEGVSMMRHGDYIYAFYAAAACCGPNCSYGSGIARAKKLLGPWEKYDKNPVITHSKEWKCPGHGTPVEKDGRYYYLYHAYSTTGDVYTGRQGLLMEFQFTKDGWIDFIGSEVPQTDSTYLIGDEFDSARLSEKWQWSVFQKPSYKIKNGNITLRALPFTTGAFIGQKTYGTNYTVDALLNGRRSTAQSGIGLLGDENNVLGVLLVEDSLKIVEVKDDEVKFISSAKVKRRRDLYLRLSVRNGYEVIFFYSSDGKDFKKLNGSPVNGSFIPPWDRAVRVGLISRGPANQQAVFKNFTLRPSRNSQAGF